MKIHFLTHMARSGSTLLARELDRYSNVSVTIEENLPDGIARGAKVLLRNPGDLDAYLDQAWHDDKLVSWGVDRHTLRRELMESHHFPFFFRDILSALTRLYFQENPPQCVIHKKGPYYLHAEAVRRAFPGSRMVHVDRDPRAIYNSQKRTRQSDGAGSMAEPVVTFAFQYLASCEVMERNQGEPDFLVVRYENLLDDPEGETLRILNFLGQKPGSREQSRYVGRIPSDQQHMHGNLDKDMMDGRRSAWKEELAPEEIVFLQKALKRTLQKKGYPLVDISLSGFAAWLRTRFRLAFFYLKYAAKRHMPGLYQWIKANTTRKQVDS